MYLYVYISTFPDTYTYLYRPRMEWLHLKRHGLLFWGIVGMVTVQAMTQKRLYLNYW